MIIDSDHTCGTLAPSSSTSKSSWPRRWTRPTTPSSSCWSSSPLPSKLSKTLAASSTPRDKTSPIGSSRGSARCAHHFCIWLALAVIFLANGCHSIFLWNTTAASFHVLHNRGAEGVKLSAGTAGQTKCKDLTGPEQSGLSKMLERIPFSGIYQTGPRKRERNRK